MLNNNKKCLIMDGATEGRDVGRRSTLKLASFLEHPNA